MAYRNDIRRDYDWDYAHGDYGLNYRSQNKSNFRRGVNRGNAPGFNRGYSPYPNDWEYPQGRNFGDQNMGYDRGYHQDYDDYDSGPGWEDYPTGGQYETWYAPGPYEGIGPRGYHRSDERIRDDIHDHLTPHGQIDARNIHVEINNGEVTLTGTVNSRREKRLAEDLTDGVTGVEEINNRLRIKQ